MWPTSIVAMPVLLAKVMARVCDLANLRHGPGDARRRRRAHGLHRVDDQHHGPGLASCRFDEIEVGVAHQVQRLPPHAKAIRAQPHLAGGLLAGGVQHGQPASCEPVHGHQQQRRLAHAGVAADEGQAASDEAAAEYVVELSHAGARPQLASTVHRHVVELHRAGGLGQLHRGLGGVLWLGLVDGVPRTTAPAAASPLQRARPRTPSTRTIASPWPPALRRGPSIPRPDRAQELGPKASATIRRAAPAPGRSALRSRGRQACG